jgi:hypothetical protein
MVGHERILLWHQANRIGRNADGVADAAERNVISANGLPTATAAKKSVPH